MNRNTLALAVASLMPAVSLATTSISLGTRQMNVSALHAPSTLPTFGGVTNSLPSPSLRPGLATDSDMDDTCPDEIQENQITIAAPTLPYRIYNDYDCGGGCGLARAKGNPGEIPTVVMESANYKALVYPSHGAKLASLVHKPSGKQLLFDNPVFQPGDLGRLNAWTSGGVEWNWPRHGHTVFTVAPLYVAEVQTERGPIVRLYEFDREMNSTYQVDLFTTDESDVFWVHVKLTNTLVDHAIDGYWWTNIAVPLHNTSRVLFPADYAAVSGAKDGKLSCVRFPEFPDDPGTLGVDLTADWPGATTLSGVGSLGLDNTHRFHTDHSYPAAYYTARENFIGMDSREPMVRAFMGIIDTETGDGTLHCQTQEQRGRKYWAWGNDPGDLGRLYFLSSCEGGASKTECLGAYLETQSGVAPTQDQFFSLPANSSIEWTETFTPLHLPTSDVTGSYDQALRAAERALNASSSSKVNGSAGVPVKEFLETDTWLRAQADVAPTRVLSHGTAWGRLHQLQTGVPLPPGQSYSASWDDATRPFAEVLINGTFSKESLAVTSPDGFIVDSAWKAILMQSAARHGSTWLHDLHLCIIQKQHAEAPPSHSSSETASPSAAAAAADYCTASNSKKPNPLATYILGDVEAAFDLAAKALKATEPVSGAERLEVDLVRDLSTALISSWLSAGNYSKISTLITALHKLPAAPASRLLNVQAMRIGAVAIALYEDKDPDKAIELLEDEEQRRGWAVSTTALVPLWKAAWQLKIKKELGRDLTALEAIKTRREHPPPASIFFGGAT